MSIITTNFLIKLGVYLPGVEVVPCSHFGNSDIFIGYDFGKDEVQGITIYYPNKELRDKALDLTSEQKVFVDHLILMALSYSNNVSLRRRQDMSDVYHFHWSFIRNGFVLEGTAPTFFNACVDALTHLVVEDLPTKAEILTHAWKDGSAYLIFDTVTPEGEAIATQDGYRRKLEWFLGRKCIALAKEDRQ